MIYNIYSKITKKEYLFNIEEIDGVFKAYKVFLFGTKYFLENTPLQGTGSTLKECIAHALG